MESLNLAVYDQLLPLLTYSFSSRGFHSVADEFRAAIPVVPSAYLISLYDFRYYLSSEDLIDSTDQRIRIWDSGGYEVNSFGSMFPIGYESAGLRQWDEHLYVETASNIPWNGKDVLVSLDTYRSEIPDFSHQIEKAISLFDKIPGKYLTDVLIHFPNLPNPKELARSLVPFIDRINILGVTEKEIARTWIDGVLFLCALREELKALGIGRQLLFHVFGCLDPKTVIYFALAGAHIFDGLTWLRYLFLNDATFYKREFQYVMPISSLLTADNIMDSVIVHNVVELEKLRSNLAYALITNDISLYNKERTSLSEVLSRRKGV